MNIIIEESGKKMDNDLHYNIEKTKYWKHNPHKKLGKNSWRVSSSYCTIGTSRVTLVTNLVISHELGKYGIVIPTNGTYLFICDA